MPRTKKVVATEEVVAENKAVEETAPVVTEEAPASEEPKYVDPRVGYVPLTPHQRKVIAKRRAKNKAARKARKAQR